MLAIGTPVEALWGGTAYEGVVVGILSNELYLVHYIGWGDEYDEIFEVGPRLRRRGGPIEHPTIPNIQALINPAGVAHAFPVGTACLCVWGGTQWQATITEQIAIPLGIVYRVNYIGWEDGFDEIVPVGRLRPALGDANAVYQQGDQVDIEWQGTWWQGTVEHVDDGNYTVHYDGWGDEYNEVVQGGRLMHHIVAAGGGGGGVFEYVPGVAVLISSFGILQRGVITAANESADEYRVRYDSDGHEELVGLARLAPS